MVPKQVNHRERRTVIAAAVERLIVRDGLDAVSMRRVATDAGMSLGQVQHYFPSKDELLRFALGLIDERLADRHVRLAAGTDPDEAGEPRRRVRDLLVERLPLDEQRTVDAHVGFAFLARAVSAPRLAEELRAGHDALHRTVGTELRRGQRDGTVRLDLDPDRAARTLLAVLDGLTAHVLIGFHSAAEAQDALDAHLDTLFTD